MHSSFPCTFETKHPQERGCKVPSGLVPTKHQGMQPNTKLEPTPQGFVVDAQASAFPSSTSISS